MCECMVQVKAALFLTKKIEIIVIGFSSPMNAQLVVSLFVSVQQMTENYTVIDQEMSMIKVHV